MLLCPPEAIEIQTTYQNNKVYSLQDTDKTTPDLWLRDLDFKNERMPAIAVFERKILRRIYGLIKNDDGSFKIRHNFELETLTKRETIIYFVES